MKFILGGGWREVQAKGGKNGGAGACPGKFFMSTPFRSMENSPLLENLLSTETKDHNQWESFQENFGIFEWYHIKTYCIFYTFWSLP